MASELGAEPLGGHLMSYDAACCDKHFTSRSTTPTCKIHVNTSRLTASPADPTTHTARPSHTIIPDLCDYVALGCLVAFPATEYRPASQWQEVTSLDHFIKFTSDTRALVSRLQQSAWIRLQAQSPDDPQTSVLRVYALPQDVGLRHIERTSRKLSMAMERLITMVDMSAHAWSGEPAEAAAFQSSATAELGSLFYFFNKLPSPNPQPSDIMEPYDREALEDLLDDSVPGLKTTLFPYQRRSAGLMLQRESVIRRELDPRLEPRTAPDGTVFYYDPWNMHIFKFPRYYDTTRGGILAETMGLGKTVICLALILATKWIPPRMPESFALQPSRPRVGSLADMAVSRIQRASYPWRVELERLYKYSGEDFSSCVQKLEASPAAYDIPYEPLRLNRRTLEKLPPPHRMTLAATTVVVVPRNLCKQWQTEIQKHVEHQALRVLHMEDLTKPLPSQPELCTYDIILFSRARFELEDKDGADRQGRRLMQSKTQRVCRCPYIGATRIRDCNCLTEDMLYDSPLKYIHFKRIIIDEGHFFGNSNKSVAVSVANKLVTADHRWVVSGTPARDLLGVEVDTSAVQNLWSAPDTQDSRDLAMNSRRDFSEQDHKGAIDSLGSLASGFLKIRPWSDRGANVRWRDHVFQHTKIRQHTHKSFSIALRRFLQSTVVKTRPEDVEADVTLPPLESSVVKLKPSFYDKITANLFTLVLTANAVTSERSDADYIFHKNSQKARSQLIANLRHSAFFWTGFSKDDITASIENSARYLAKEGTGCTDADRHLLSDVVDGIKDIPDVQGWISLSQSHEMGIFVTAWPEESAEHWAFDQCEEPLMVGITQLIDAQNFVDRRIGLQDPGEGLSGEGIKALAPLRAPAISKTTDQQASNASLADSSSHGVLTKSGIPASSLDGEPRRRRVPSNTASPNGKSLRRSPSKALSSTAPASTALPADTSTADANTDPDNVPAERQYPIPEQYTRTRVIGTASAKLSYLATQILKYHRTEKILVFYEGQNAAFYIAQMLELLHIKHEIYAKSLKASLKSEYIVRFNENDDERVLLMDTDEAAFGLNLSSASRIYFVNPVYRPNVEAQAIKRAHRIGQTRKVTVETLVLSGSIEEKMLERSRRMTSAEHSHAKSLEDDGGIRAIIQAARLIPTTESERTATGQMALLESPQRLWGLPRTDVSQPAPESGSPGSAVLGHSTEIAHTGKRPHEIISDMGSKVLLDAPQSPLPKRLKPEHTTASGATPGSMGH